MLSDILRFNRQSTELLQDPDDAVTVAEYLRQQGYSRQFADNYLLPMGAAIWSCPTATFEQFPMRFIVEFYLNHGLLSIKDRPTWRVIKGGSFRYVEALTRGFADRIQLNTPVQAVRRLTEGVCVVTRSGSEMFDEVILACHSDQALAILGADATRSEREVLSAIPYQPNTAVLHTDTSLLPRRRSAWASWNYHIPAGQQNSATLTYNMNILQHIQSRHTYCVTLNEESLIDPQQVIARFRYSHPIFTVDRQAAQKRHRELIRQDRVSLCGAYWGNGFHEDGVCSALAVTDAFEGLSRSDSRGTAGTQQQPCTPQESVHA
jgi:predicted NAD/FAD-binding protein